MGRPVIESAWAARQIEALCADSPNFRKHLDGITWRLARDPGLWQSEGYQLPDRDPPVYLVVTAAMRPIGIGALKIMYGMRNPGIEILAIAVVRPK